ncbi:MAG: hypothetical protein M3O24_00250 [Thermoproteota archaeon]|nr:hypothetical protein [Thermoproteota archaeon]
MNVSGYVCSPHNKSNELLVEAWKKSDNVDSMYFVTATFPSDCLPYFPNPANHYVLAKYGQPSLLLSGISSYFRDKLSFFFIFNTGLFERYHERLSYVSVYFTKYPCEDFEISEIANSLARRDRVKTARIGHLQFVNGEYLRFTFPYSKNIIVLEVEGDKSHQSDQRYCEKTRMDVARKGISLNNLVSFSILNKLK